MKSAVCLTATHLLRTLLTKPVSVSVATTCKLRMGLQAAPEADPPSQQLVCFGAADAVVVLGALP